MSLFKKKVTDKNQTNSSGNIAVHIHFYFQGYIDIGDGCWWQVLNIGDKSNAIFNSKSQAPTPDIGHQHDILT